MESSRIGAGFRSIFNITPSTSRRTSDRDAQGRQEEKPKQERQPTEEEAQRALQILLGMESVLKNKLTAVLECVEGIYCIRVSDASGQALRSLHGEEILRLLAIPSENSKSANRGRILDRRV